MLVDDHQIFSHLMFSLVDAAARGPIVDAEQAVLTLINDWRLHSDNIYLFHHLDRSPHLRLREAGRRVSPDAAARMMPQLLECAFADRNRDLDYDDRVLSHEWSSVMRGVVSRVDRRDARKLYRELFGDFPDEEPSPDLNEGARVRWEAGLLTQGLLQGRLLPDDAMEIIRGLQAEGRGLSALRVASMQPSIAAVWTGFDASTKRPLYEFHWRADRHLLLDDDELSHAPQRIREIGAPRVDAAEQYGLLRDALDVPTGGGPLPPWSKADDATKEAAARTWDRAADKLDITWPDDADGHKPRYLLRRIVAVPGLLADAFREATLMRDRATSAVVAEPPRAAAETSSMTVADQGGVSTGASLFYARDPVTGEPYTGVERAQSQHSEPIEIDEIGREMLNAIKRVDPDLHQQISRHLDALKPESRKRSFCTALRNLCEKYPNSNLSPPTKGSAATVDRESLCTVLTHAKALNIIISRLRGRKVAKRPADKSHILAKYKFICRWCGLLCVEPLDRPPQSCPACTERFTKDVKSDDRTHTYYKCVTGVHPGWRFAETYHYRGQPGDRRPDGTCICTSPLVRA